MSPVKQKNEEQPIEYNLAEHNLNQLALNVLPPRRKKRVQIA
jgi:hypothetical protein